MRRTNLAKKLINARRLPKYLFEGKFGSWLSCDEMRYNQYSHKRFGIVRSTRSRAAYVLVLLTLLSLFIYVLYYLDTS